MLGALQDSYRRALHEWRQLHEAMPDLSAPHLLAEADGYATCSVRLMVVGQETFGWGGKLDLALSPEQAVEHLCGVYRAFNLGAQYRRSPFWQAASRLEGRLNPEGPSRAFLWSNLGKVDQAKRRASPQIEERVADWALLQAELEHFRPEVVVFFTGPYYDQLLRRVLPGAELLPVVSQVVRVSHELLPERSFRTYHPSYLRRSRQWSTLDTLIELCQSPS